MYRLTTPTHTFEFPDDPSLYSKILITYQQFGKNILEKKESDMTFEKRCEKYYGKISLSQEETSLFSDMTNTLVQVRVLTLDGKSYASDIFQIQICPVLNDTILLGD